MANKNPLKVLMFGWELPPFNSGGLGVACFGLTKALANEGVEITFVLPQKVDLEINFMKIIFASDDTHKVSYKKLITYTFPSLYGKKDSRGIMRFDSLLDEVKYYGLVGKTIAETEDFDIIHIHDWLTAFAGIEAKKVSGKPLIVHIHATEFDRTGTKYGNRIVYDIEKLVMEYADMIIPVSNYTKNIITSQYGIPESNITVIHNGVEQPPADITEDVIELKKHNKIVLFVGRLTLQKGPDYFIQTAKKVLEFYPDVIFLVVGSGDMKEQLIRDSVKLGISDRVIFTGFMRNAQLRKLYKSADLFVMPSVSEPFGIAGLESAINGTPILVSKQSGVSEVLTHALKVDFWDTDEMTNKIVSVLKNKSLQGTLKENSMTESRNISWEKSAKKMKQVYTSVMSRFIKEKK